MDNRLENQMAITATNGGAELNGRIITLKKYHDTILTVLIALSVSVSTLWFMRPLNFYIFGQDSYSFIHPLYYSVNPFYSFNNGIENIFSASIISLLGHLVTESQSLERVLAIIGVFVSLIGLGDLIQLFKKIGGSSRNSPLFLVIPMVFYVYNPYTLTVTWPHFLTWSASMITAPYIISFFIYVIYYGFNMRRFALTSILLMILAGTVSGAMLPFFLIIAFVAFIFSGIYTILKKLEIGELLKRESTILAFVIAISLFTFLPLYFSKVYSTPASYSTSYILQYWESESSSTTLEKVLSLLAYNQVSPGSLSYPWIQSLSIISLFSLLIIIIVAIRIFIRGIHRPVLFLGIISLLAVVFSTGSNFPFGYINEKLLLLKGPFLFLINPYGIKSWCKGKIELIKRIKLII